MDNGQAGAALSVKARKVKEATASALRSQAPLVHSDEAAQFCPFGMQCVPPLDQRILPDGLRDEATYARKWLTRRLGEERAGLGEQRRLGDIPTPLSNQGSVQHKRRARP